MNGRGNYAYFAKCKNKMNYMNGQIACKKTGGFMVEFNFKDDQDKKEDEEEEVEEDIEDNKQDNEEDQENQESSLGKFLLNIRKILLQIRKIHHQYQENSASKNRIPEAKTIFATVLPTGGGWLQLPEQGDHV